MSQYIHCKICKTDHHYSAFEQTGGDRRESDPPGNPLDWAILKCAFTGLSFTLIWFKNMPYDHEEPPHL